jgi:hypothetical protein
MLWLFVVRGILKYRTPSKHVPFMSKCYNIYIVYTVQSSPKLSAQFADIRRYLAQFADIWNMHKKTWKINIILKYFSFK